MKVYSSHDDVFQVVEGLVVLEVDVQTILNTDLHLHRDNFSGPFDLFVREQNCEVDLFDDVELSGDYDTDEVSNSSCDSVEGLVLLLEVWELELVRFIFCENAGGF